MSFEAHVELGRTGLSVSRVGLAPGPGGKLPASEIERAFERGVNYLYWGSLRATNYRDAIRNIGKSRREKLVLVVQSYARFAWAVTWSLEWALRALKTDYADLFILGWRNQPPPRAILDAALALKERGLTRHLMISCHERSTFKQYIADPSYGAIMVRYNAAHPGAEQDVFPFLPAEAKNRPGVVAYTVTRWGQLIDASRTPSQERVPTSTDCYRFALTAKDVSLCLSAPQSSPQLDQTLATLSADPMSAEEIAWMKRVGAYVKEGAGKRGRRSPIEMIDRLAARLAKSSGESMR